MVRDDKTLLTSLKQLHYEKVIIHFLTYFTTLWL